MLISPISSRLLYGGMSLAGWVSMRNATIGAIALFTAVSVGAQDITPQPATPEDDILMTYLLPVPGCYFDVTEASHSVSGNTVIVYFEVEPVAMPICGTPPDLTLNMNLGEFLPGSYQLELTGVINGGPFGPLTSEFQVRGGSPPVSVPSLGPAGSSLLVIFLMLLGSVSCRRG